MALRPPQVCRGRGGTLRGERCSWSYICPLCHSSCDSALSLAEHFVGNKHKRKLQQPEHQEQNDEICLSYFLKAHMKEEHIVGLEYIQEVKKDSSYTYSCRLCKVLNTDLPAIVRHIVNLLHIERYIDKHFTYLLPPYRDRIRGRRSEYKGVLRNAAVMILEQQGRKEIQVVNPESDGKTREASEDTPPSKPESAVKTRDASEDTPPPKPESDGKTREASEDTPPSKPESDGKTGEASQETLPSKPESDGKTRDASKDTPPSKPESDGKTRDASKDTPSSKPESDGKTRDASKDTPSSKPESDGKTRDASKDTPPSKPESDGKTRDASKDTPPSKPESDGKTREASKDTPPSKPENGGKMREAIKDTPPSKPECGNSYSKFSPKPYQKMGLDESRKSCHYNKMLQNSISNDPPLAKRSRRSHGSDQDALPSTAQISKHGSSHNKSHATRMDCTATQKLEFRANDEFFEYFANFVISDDEDVLFIRTINQNCIKALTSFQEEDAEGQKTGQQPEAPLVDTSRTAQKIPGILEDETESHLSDSKTTLLKDNSNPPSDSSSKNEATALFFNSIKDMDESDVVRFFQKLAATNPEFQEIDIPTVIRFLKNSGRFKKP